MFTYNQTKEILKECGRFEVSKWEHYGMTVIDAENGEYAVTTDYSDLENAAGEYIKDTVWAFNADFIIEHSKCLDYDKPSREIIACIQDKCENGNDAMTRLIDDMDEFIDDAISADGIGHFLSSYDGEVIECKHSVYLVRIN